MAQDVYRTAMNGAAALQDILKSFIKQGHSIVDVYEAEGQYVILVDKKQSRPKAETR